MKAEILVPFREVLDPSQTRIRNWRYVRSHWQKDFPDWKLTETDDGRRPFSRGHSINQAAASSDADVLVIADADVVVPKDQVIAAVEAARARPGIVLAFDDYRITTEDQANRIRVRQKQVFWQCAQADWMSISACVVISRAGFNEVGGYNPKCRGWGAEDDIFEYACSTLLGPTRRIKGPAWHLWHHRETTMPRLNQEIGFEYRAAQMNKYKMAQLIARDHGAPILADLFGKAAAS